VTEVEITEAPRAAETLRVLLVDDHDLFRTGLRNLLEEQGVNIVAEAGDGNEAVDAVRDHAPDVVVMDLNMPGMTGVEATRHIATVSPLTKVLVLTISDQDGDVIDAIMAGASGYLLKDASIDEVAQAVALVADGQSLISPSMATKLLDEFKQMSVVGRRQDVAAPRLTDRELEVLRLVARGLNNRDIAKDLFISENTVKNHVRNILEKLQLHSRMEAVMYAVREKLLDIP
jgi:two-component system NarL family response regulator